MGVRAALAVDRLLRAAGEAVAAGQAVEELMREDRRQVAGEVGELARLPRGGVGVAAVVLLVAKIELAAKVQRQLDVEAFAPDELLALEAVRSLIFLLEAGRAQVRAQPVAPESEEVAEQRLARLALEAGAAVETRRIEGRRHRKVVAAHELLEVLAVEAEPLHVGAERRRRQRLVAVARVQEVRLLAIAEVGAVGWWRRCSRGWRSAR